MAIEKFDNDFEVARSSDLRYEKLTTEILYKHEPIIQIIQDKGVDKLEVELHSLPNKSVKLPLNDLITLINRAVDRLKE
jgi:hypothetical protein